MPTTTDLVVVGGGAAGLLAAVAARRLGHRVIVVEASDRLGGATALGDGRLWLPASDQAARLGPDSPESAAEYLDALVGPAGDEVKDQRRRAFVRTAPRLARWLTTSRLPLVALRGVGDTHSTLPGARSQGRVLATQPVNRASLGEDWSDRLHRPATGVSRSWNDRLVDTVTRRDLTVSRGEALATALLRRATASGVEIWPDSVVTGLLGSSERISGVVVHRTTGEWSEVEELFATSAVLLACGGFEAGQSLREEYLPLPTDSAWSASGSLSEGTLITAAVELGAAAANLDDAWWEPVMLAEGRAWEVSAARTAPHAIIVDSAGDRFVNEAGTGVAVGRQFFDRNRGVRSIPSYLVLDNRHRQQQRLGPWAAGAAVKRAVEAGDIVRATTLNDLAEQLGIDRAGLLGTAVRFNSFAAKGRDLDFGRGGRQGERRRNPLLGKLDKQPYWAVRLYPGDLGTKGGLIIDADSRVLRDDGTALPGLLACSGTAASMLPRVSPAPGAALGTALVEAFRAATKLTGPVS